MARFAVKNLTPVGHVQYINCKALCDHLERLRIFTSVSYKFYISTFILKLERTVCMVCNF